MNKCENCIFWIPNHEPQLVIIGGSLQQCIVLSVLYKNKMYPTDTQLAVDLIDDIYDEDPPHEVFTGKAFGCVHFKQK